MVSLELLELLPDRKSSAAGELGRCDEIKGIIRHITKGIKGNKT